MSHRPCDIYFIYIALHEHLPHMPRYTVFQQSGEHIDQSPHPHVLCTSCWDSIQHAAPFSSEFLGWRSSQVLPYRNSLLLSNSAIPALQPYQHLPAQWIVVVSCWLIEETHQAYHPWWTHHRRLAWTTQTCQWNGRACTLTSWKTFSEAGKNHPPLAVPPPERRNSKRTLHWRKTSLYRWCG